MVINVFGTPRNQYLEQEAVFKSNAHLTLRVLGTHSAYTQFN